MPEGIDIFDVLGAITPFILLGLGWWYNYQQKKTKKAESTEAELEQMKEKSLKDDLADAIKRLDQATADTKEMKDLAHEITENFQALSAMNRLNGQYTHELAQLVMVLAEGLRDQHLNGNITRAVEKYRKFEADALGSVVTGEYPMMGHNQNQK